MIRTRHARKIRQGIRLLRLNWPRFRVSVGAGRYGSYSYLTLLTWYTLERRAERAERGEL